MARENRKRLIIQSINITKFAYNVKYNAYGTVQAQLHLNYDPELRNNFPDKYIFKFKIGEDLKCHTYHKRKSLSLTFLKLLYPFYNVAFTWTKIN